MSWRHLLTKTKPFGCIEKEEPGTVIVGAPLDSTSTYRPGSRLAPDSIREAACNLELYSLLGRRSLEHIGLTDLGNIVIPQGDVELSLRNIKTVAKGVREDYPDSLKVFVGGEHLVTLPIVEALGDLVDTVVIFDAHLDMRSEYLGSTLNHATFARRLVEEGFRVVHIGSRALSAEEAEYVKDLDNVRVLDVLEARRGVNTGKLGSVYISVDMDVVDPSYAPGVGNPEPLGLTPWELLELVRELVASSSRLVGVDVVEVNPLVDPGGVTSVLASKIILEVIGLYLR
ncbi:agmatinase [Thermogladius sp. KZ2Tp1]|uniref:agmatinase n=1 Tax=Thermogladius sp. KZ2Tp1 TaxID=3136289 RepID=UPI003DAA374D